MMNPNVQELLHTLEEGVASVYSSEAWKDVLTMQARFHNYSFSNVFLILSQMPNATRVAGFNTWKELRRYVKKGEKAIKILAPLITNKEVETENEEGEKVVVKKSVVYGFRVVNVFDISQTDGKPLPSLVEELTGNSDIGEALYEALRKVIKIPVSFGETGDAKGYYSPAKHEIVLKPGMSKDQTAKTLLHEYVHSLLHNKEAEKKGSYAQSEAEAEGTAYVVATYFGLDTSDYSFGYVAGWASREDGVELVKKVGNTIQATALKIISELETILKEMKQPERESA